VVLLRLSTGEAATRGALANGATEGPTDRGRDRDSIGMRSTAASPTGEEAAAAAGPGAAAASPAVSGGAWRPTAVVRGRPEEAAAV
jgi:hypothetical protein